MIWNIQDVKVSTRFLRTVGTCLLLLGVLFCFPAISHGSINHGDYAGATVDYLQVTEDTNTGDALPLFGAPTVIGDSMDFDPIGFSANSSGGGPPDQTDGQLSFDIVAKGGHVISNVQFSEAGDTSLARGLGSLDDALTSVTATIFIDILEVTSGPIVPFNAGPFAMVFTPSDGDYLLSVDGAGDPTYNTAWTGSILVDMAPILAAANVDGDVTRLSVNLDNTLTASSATASSAFIAKKDFDGITITPNIPEPTAGLLAVMGLLAMFSTRRRSR